MDADNHKQIKISIENCLPDITTDNIREEILTGLTADPKYISSKYFYNKEGSLLFEKITGLEEYYPTRTEKSIIESNAKEFVEDISGTTIIELGSGDCSKIYLLLDAISDKDLGTITYCPVDFSITAIEDSAKCLSNRYNDLKIKGFAADFLHRLDYISKQTNKLICFFGSTIGNLSHLEAIDFVKQVAAMMKQGDRFILGMDMIKEKKILEAAYNDNLGITGEFNKNILNTINPIIETDINPDSFEHKALYNEELNRIEMHLIAKESMEYFSPYSGPIVISKGENIHTENSHKFSEKDINTFAENSGLNVKKIYQDHPNKWFSLVLFEK